MSTRVIGTVAASRGWPSPSVMFAAGKDGKIIEQGNHESLLARQGFYAELYNSQFAGVEEA